MIRSRTLVVALLVGALVVLAAVVGPEAGPETPFEQRVEGKAVEVRDGRGISSSTATLIAGGLALAGVAVGLFGDRYLRYRGDIVCRSREWSLDCILQPPTVPDQGYDRMPFERNILADEQLMERAQHAIYNCNVKLFNEKEVDTGLRDVTVVFVDDLGTPLISSEPQIIKGREGIDDADVVNLPARQWVGGIYQGSILAKDFGAIARSSRVELRAHLPRDKPFVRELHRLWL